MTLLASTNHIISILSENMCSYVRNTKTQTKTNKLLEKYKQRCLRNFKLPTFAKNISLSFHAKNCFKPSQPRRDNINSQDEQGIYLLQTVKISNNDFTIFFDNGCSDFIVKHSVIGTLGAAATKESSEAIHIGGVGNTTTFSTLGSYNVKIPNAQWTDSITLRKLHQGDHPNFSSIPTNRSYIRDQSTPINQQEIILLSQSLQHMSVAKFT